MANSRPYCTESTTYDAKHLAKHGRDCDKKHKLFIWKATGTCKALLLSDSICKWITHPGNFDVAAIPGLGLEYAVQKVRDGTLQILNYEYILVHVATNDVAMDIEKGGIPRMHFYLHALCREIKTRSPYTTLAISSVLPRPRDKGLGDDPYRMQVNSMIYRYASSHGHHYMESWRALTKADGTTNRGLFAHDLLHLRDPGVNALKLYFQGYIGFLHGYYMEHV
jgi:hypothetical protein